MALNASIILSLIMCMIVPTFSQCQSFCRSGQNSKCCCPNKTVMICNATDTGECVIESPKSPKTIKKVVVEKCRIFSLSNQTFGNLSKTSTTELQLIYVRIDSIAADSFTPLTTLNTLKLSHCSNIGLYSLGKAIQNIQIPNNITLVLERLYIGDENITTLFSNLSVSKIGNLNLAKNLIKRLPLNNLQTFGYLWAIDLSNNRINNLTQAPVQEMKNVTKLNLDGNNLMQLTYEHWKTLSGKLPNLEYLSLKENDITNIGAVCWDVFPNLTILDLDGNHITHLDFSSLQPLNNLEELYVCNNWLSSLAPFKAPMYSLKRLSLTRNNFATFAPWLCNKSTALSLYPNLEYLDLSYNLLRYTVKQAWSCLENLRELDLSGNPFKVIQNNSLADLMNLERLWIKNIYASLETVEPAAFNISNLKHLDLSLAGILFGVHPELTEIFRYLRKLTSLNLSYNRFYQLKQDNITHLLSPLLSIEMLNLTGIGIYRLPTGLLGMFENLTILILNKNKLETRDLQGTFNSSVNLKKLSLADNFIRVVQNSSFVGRIMKTLEVIDLSNNPFDCECSNVWFRGEIEKNLKQNSMVYKHWPQTYLCRTPVHMSGQQFKVFHKTSKDCEQLNEMVIAYVTMGGFLFVVVVTSLIMYKFRWYIKYWRYKMNRKKKSKKDPETRPLLNKALNFDAYIIYKLDDEKLEKFIRNDFDPMVESLGYRCFYWDRHAGVGAKVSEIGDGIYGSRNVIAIVNNSFLKDRWCKFQIEVALDRQIEVQKEILMFVVLEDVDFQLLNKFWCVRFTKSPTARWCSDTKDIKRKVLEAYIKNTLGDPGPRNRAALQQSTSDIQ